MGTKAVNVLPYNDAAIASARVAEGEKAKEYKIEGVPGLTLIVAKSGTATFYVRYQVGKGAGKKFRREQVGRHPLIKLKDAKAKAVELMTAVEKGGDPYAESEAKAQEAASAAKARASALTLQKLFELRKAGAEGGAVRTLDSYEQLLKKDVFPTLGAMPADDIAPESIAEVLEAIEARSKHSAHRVRSALGSTYRWGLKRRKVKSNPVKDLGFIYRGERRVVTVSDDELTRLWEAFDHPDLHATEPMRLILKLALLTGQRNSEVAGTEKSELRLDGPNPRLTIPARRMKRKTEDQLVPLSAQAVDLFKRAVELSGDATHVFPGAATGRNEGYTRRQGHISQGAVSRTMARARELAGLEGVRLHDLRKVLTTWLSEQLEHPAVLDRILHHARAGVTGTHYDMSTLEGPIRVALQRWANHVWAVTGQAGGNIVAMKRA